MSREWSGVDGYGLVWSGMGLYTTRILHGFSGG